jgi:hypothetical protein
VQRELLKKLSQLVLDEDGVYSDMRSDLRDRNTCTLADTPMLSSGEQSKIDTMASRGGPARKSLE